MLGSTVLIYLLKNFWPSCSKYMKWKVSLYEYTFVVSGNCGLCIGQPRLHIHMPNFLLLAIAFALFEIILFMCGRQWQAHLCNCLLVKTMHTCTCNCNTCSIKWKKFRFYFFKINWKKLRFYLILKHVILIFFCQMWYWV